MHGQPDTAAQLEELLAEFRDDYCTQVRAKLVSYASTNAPCADSVEYDMHVGLLELIKIFAARNPSTDLMLPEVRQSKCVVCMMHIPIFTYCAYTRQWSSSRTSCTPSRPITRRQPAPS